MGSRDHGRWMRVPAGRGGGAWDVVNGRAGRGQDDVRGWKRKRRWSDVRVAYMRCSGRCPGSKLGNMYDAPLVLTEEDPVQPNVSSFGRCHARPSDSSQHVGRSTSSCRFASVGRHVHRPIAMADATPSTPPREETHLIERPGRRSEPPGRARPRVCSSRPRKPEGNRIRTVGIGPTPITWVPARIEPCRWGGGEEPRGRPLRGGS